MTPNLAQALKKVKPKNIRRQDLEDYREGLRASAPAKAHGLGADEAVVRGLEEKSSEFRAGGGEIYRAE